MPRMYLHLYILFVIPLNLIARCFVRTLISVCMHRRTLPVVFVMDSDCIREMSSWGIGVDGHDQYGIALSYANPFRLGEVIGVPWWSQALLSVAVWGPLVIQKINRTYRLRWSTPSIKTIRASFIVGVADFFTQRVISLGPKLLYWLKLFCWPSSSDPRPCYC